MDASNKAFDQVKRILDKLDRSIDEARNKRLGTDEPEAPEKAQTSSENGHAAKPATPMRKPEHPAQAPAASPKKEEPSPRRSAYGRAKPLRRDNGPDASMWRHSNG